MPKGKYVTLPGSKTAQREPQPFPVGSMVYLASCHFGHPGTVLGTKRSKVLVRWPAPLSFTGKHSPAALVLADLSDDMPNNIETETEEDVKDG